MKITTYETRRQIITEQLRKSTTVDWQVRDTAYDETAQPSTTRLRNGNTQSDKAADEAWSTTLLIPGILFPFELNAHSFLFEFHR